MMLKDRKVRQAWLDVLSVYRGKITKELTQATSTDALLNAQGKLALLETFDRFPDHLEAELDKVRQGNKSWLVR